MNYQVITMALAAINTIAIVIVGVLIFREIKKQNRPDTLDELWRNFASKPENRKDLERIFEKYTKNETANKR